MQIMPTSSASGAAFFSGMDLNSQNGSDFLSAMENALSAVGNGEYFSADAALADESGQPTVDSPYTRHTTDGVTYTLSEVCFTQQELQELRQQLVKEGAPETSLRQFDILADQPAGATLAQVMASLMGSSKTVDLSEEDAQAITALLGQIDPSGQLATDALDAMRRGNPMGALDLIQSALGQLSASDGIGVDAEGLAALGRGLGLDTNAMRNLLGGLGGRTSATLNASQFDTLLNPAKDQILSESADLARLDAALEKTLKPIISKARNRMEKEKAASELENRRVAQSRVLIDETVQERSRQMIDDTVTGDAIADARGDKELAGLADTLKLRDTDANVGKESVGQEREVAGNSRQTVKIPVRDGESGFDNDAGSGLMDQNRGKSDAWQDLLGKLETKVTATAANTGLNTSSFVYSMLQSDIMQQPYNAANQLLEGEAQLSQRLASQVQQGLLTATRDGATRLDLQLHPAELGAITITLVARNGEVTAQIRSEKSETAEMMTRQLDTIRVNLEQQGVRVDKIEVQLDNRQDNGGNIFSDLGEHNARQEEDARRQTLARLRNLASLRNDSINSDESGLAQSLHIMGQSARYAGQALHVVA